MEIGRKITTFFAILIVLISFWNGVINNQNKYERIGAAIMTAIMCTCIYYMWV